MRHPITALIPSYEPDERLYSLANRLREMNISVIIVNDGSSEKFQPIFDRLENTATVISYKENCGKGHALKTGFNYIMQSNPTPDTVIVTLDSDGQHTPEDALRVADAAAENPSSLVLGVRKFGDNTPLRSKIGNSITRGVYYLSTGLRVSDTQTGLRAFGVKLLPWLLAKDGNRYDYEMNVLISCPAEGIPIFEVPIETVYFDRNKGSHFRTFTDSFLVYKNILKFAASSAAGFVIDYSLFSLFTALLSPLGTAVSVPLSNIIARLVSASANFTINRHFVFGSKDSAVKTGAQYFLLAAFILCGNTLLVSFLTSGLGLNKYIAKLITEATFFAISFLIQRFWIFRKNPQKG